MVEQLVFNPKGIGLNPIKDMINIEKPRFLY
jgi:hypothetical protein